MPRLIAAYLAEFDRALGFDRRLARRVHREVEAHLEDALGESGSETEAIRRFGNPQTLARAYAEAALPMQLRTTWVVSLAMLVTTFLAMRLRSVVLALPDAQADSLLALTVLDRTCFAAGLTFGMFAIHVRGRGAQAMVPGMMAAAAALLISASASLMRATIVAGDAPLIWWTGGAELLAIAAAAVQILLLQRHAALASR